MNANLSKKFAAAIIASISLTGTASAQVVYQDSFSRTGVLAGTTPDVTDTNGNVWEQVYSDFGSTPFNTDGSTVSLNSGYGDGGAFLPINGTSGVILDGTLNFTLSGTINSNSSGSDSSIGLTSASNPNVGGGVSTSWFAGLNVNNQGNAFAMYGGGYHGSTFEGKTVPVDFSLTYDASAGTITFSADGTVINTETGITAAQISALTFVGLGGNYNSNGTGPATFDDFTLSIAGVAAPEPSTYVLVLSGLVTFAGLRRMRNRCA